MALKFNIEDFLVVCLKCEVIDLGDSWFPKKGDPKGYDYLRGVYEGRIIERGCFMCKKI